MDYVISEVEYSYVKEQGRKCIVHYSTAAQDLSIPLVNGEAQGMQCAISKEGRTGESYVVEAKYCMKGDWRRSVA